MTRYTLPLVVIAATVAAVPPAHAGPILNTTSNLSTDVYGEVAGNPVYHWSATTPQSGPAITLTASGLYPFDGSISSSGATSGNAAISPTTDNFSSLHLDLTASGSNSNGGSSAGSSYGSAYIQYDGSFTLDSTMNYQLTISGATGSAASITSNGYDSGDVYAYLVADDGSFFSLYEKASSSVFAPYDSGPVNLSGTLAAGTYHVFAYAEAYSSLDGNQNAGGRPDYATDSASVAFDLTVAQAVPAPPSVILLGTGLLCLAGYGIRGRCRLPGNA